MRRILVTDASVVVDLLGRFDSKPIEDELFCEGRQLVAPELLDIEVMHTLRKLETTDVMPVSRRHLILDDFRALPIRRFRHTVLWNDIWTLRHNLSAYDACYVALARQLEATLVTRDKRIAAAPNTGVEIRVI